MDKAVESVQTALNLEVGSQLVEPPPEQEITVKEANRRIREEAKQEKRQAKAASRGVGAGLQVLGRCQRRHPANPKAQLAMFLGEFVIKSAIGRSRPVSEKTNSAYANTLIGCIDDLKINNAAVRNLGELGKTHVAVLVKYWLGRGQAASTVQNKISVLRCFLTWIGKEGAVPRGEDLKVWLSSKGIEAPKWRNSVATQDKTWVNNGIDLRDVAERASGLCNWTAVHLEMQEAFGLRVLESLSIIPEQSDYGDMLQINYGTKGGLSRSVPFVEDAIQSARQRDVLERAKVLAKSNPKGLLSRPGHSLRQNQRHFYHVMEKLGVTRNEMGVTAHGLRHQHIGVGYEAMNGFPTPVSGNMPAEITPEMKQADLMARRKLSRVAGHFRDSVTKAYVGSIPMMTKARTKLVANWVDLTEGNDRLQLVLKKYGVKKAWLGGRFAAGLEVAPEERIRLHVSAQEPLEYESLSKLGVELADCVARGFDLGEMRGDDTPENGVEIFVRNIPFNNVNKFQMPRDEGTHKDSLL
jgi:site-specific recombinase XerC